MLHCNSRDTVMFVLMTDNMHKLRNVSVQCKLTQKSKEAPLSQYHFLKKSISETKENLFPIPTMKTVFKK